MNPATAENRDRVIALLPPTPEGYIACWLVSWVAYEFDHVGDPEQYLRGAEYLSEIIEEGGL